MTQFGQFANYGFVRDQVPTDLLSKLRNEVDSLDLNDTTNQYNDHLAGNIEHEFLLKEHHADLESYLISLANEYTSTWDITRTIKDLRSNDLEMFSYWANIQKKHEFNPMHAHDGIYSFVIWLDIPYLMQDEIQQPMARKTNSPRSGMFSFIYTNIFGEIREAEFAVDKAYEGTVFLFPAALQHTVYPFSSTDKKRISISGNLRRKQ